MTEENRCKECDQIINPNKRNSYLHNLLIAFDQLGNAFAGGNPDTTISARVGYYANYNNSKSGGKNFWKITQTMINIAWWPYERDDHCKDAYDADPELPYPDTIFARVLLFLEALVFSIIVSAVLYFLYLFSPTLWKRRKCKKCRQIIRLKKLVYINGNQLINQVKQSIVHIAVVVRDYDEAIKFYTKKLKFELIEDTYKPEQDKRWVVVAPPGSTGTTVLLAKASKPEQENFIGNQAGGRVFLFLNTDDFWRDYNDMIEKGIEFVREPKQADYGTVAVFKDLYGNLWDLLKLNPEHPITQRMNK